VIRTPLCALGLIYLLKAGVDLNYDAGLDGDGNQKGWRDDAFLVQTPRAFMHAWSD